MAKTKPPRRHRATSAPARTASRSRVFPKFNAARLRPTLGVLVLCTGLVFVASWVGLFDLVRIDTWTERQFVRYADAFTYEDINPDVVLITAAEDPQGNGTLGNPGPNWRGYHAALVNALSQETVKAKVIAFDLLFEDSTGNDGDFNSAIKKATASGTTVVLGVKEFETREGVSHPIAAEGVTKDLEERNWGFLKIGGAYLGTSAVRKLRLASEVNSDLPSWAEAPEPKIAPSFTLQVLRASISPPVGPAIYAKGAGRLELRDGTGQAVKSIPVDAELNYIVNERQAAALAEIDNPYHEVYKNRDNVGYLFPRFHEKIVIIGFKSWKDLPGLKEGDPTYGVEIQASALSDLLRSVHITKLKSVWHCLMILVMSSIGLVIGSRYRQVLRPQIPVTVGSVGVQIGFPLLLFAVTAAYLLFAIMLYKYNRVLLGIPYHVTALFLTFALVDQIEASRKTGRSK